MVADVVDSDNVESGGQRTGLYFSLITMTQKVGGALAIGIAYPLLGWLGFSPGAEVQTQQAMDAVRPVVELLRQIGERYPKSPSQVALRWLIENEHVLPIPGAKNSQQAAENAGALSFSLSPKEVEMLNQATMAWRK